MAEHADAAEQLDDAAPVDEDSEGHEREADDSVETPGRQWLRGARSTIAVGLVIVAAFGGLAGWLGYRSYHAHEAQARRNLFVQVARQAAINLTTINYTEVDADMQRILDSTTGTFHDDFRQRSRPFVEVVKQAQSKSEGTVTEAGLGSETGDQAQVLLAVSVKTSIPAAPDQDPRRWRMRISVQKVGDGAKISNVEFVP